MSSVSGADARHSTKKSSEKTSFKPKCIAEIEVLEPDDIIDYIKQLHACLRRNQRRLKKYKAKIKQLKRVHVKDVPVLTTTGAQLEQEPTTAPNDDKENEEDACTSPSAAAAFSFVDEMRQAAKHAQNLNDFIYEPTSGLYYDQKTGYYYNAEYGLYYDGNTGCYYSYNQKNNSFEFHSQVQVQPNKTAKQESVAENEYEVEVEFDEFGGVITDEERLKQIRAEKKKLLKEAKDYRQKKKETRRTGRKSKKPKRTRSPSRSRSRSRSESQPRSGSRSRSSSDSDWSQRRRKHEFEEGELSSDTSDSNSELDGGDSKNNGVPQFKSGSEFQDLARKYPPPLRIIVQETNLDELKVGSLSLITFKGGSLGREGNHDVIIPDLNVSKSHLNFTYDTKAAVYKCIDVGSQNGTILNGTRMSASKTKSQSYDLVHGSVLQVGSTKLLCHVHEGNSTCGLCEPGLLIEAVRDAATVGTAAATLTHREQLKLLQKKYGLENEKFVDGKQTSGNYNDRAASRRIKVGSTTDGEKTEAASVNTEISSHSKGFKMLSKLGWNKGETLGKSSVGLLEPINLASNQGTKGLGCEDSAASFNKVLSASERKKIDTWKKAQERYQKTDIFCPDDDDSSENIK